MTAFNRRILFPFSNLCRLLEEKSLPLKLSILESSRDTSANFCKTTFWLSTLLVFNLPEKCPTFFNLACLQETFLRSLNTSSFNHLYKLKIRDVNLFSKPQVLECCTAGNYIVLSYQIKFKWDKQIEITLS